MNSNRLGALNVSENPELRVLWCYENELTSLDLSKNTELEDVSLGNNEKFVTA